MTHSRDSKRWRRYSPASSSALSWEQLALENLERARAERLEELREARRPW